VRVSGGAGRKRSGGGNAAGAGDEEGHVAGLARRAGNLEIGEKVFRANRGPHVILQDGRRRFSGRSFLPGFDDRGFVRFARAGRLRGGGVGDRDGRLGQTLGGNRRRGGGGPRDQIRRG